MSVVFVITVRFLLLRAKLYTGNSQLFFRPAGNWILNMSIELLVWCLVTVVVCVCVRVTELVYGRQTYV